MQGLWFGFQFYRIFVLCVFAVFTVTALSEMYANKTVSAYDCRKSAAI